MRYTEEVETTRRNRLWTGIAAISGAMRVNTVFKLGHIKIYPNQYIVLVGPSGVRKTTPLEIGREIMSLAGVPLSAAKTTPEGLIVDMKDVEIEDEGKNLVSSGSMKGSAALTVYGSELSVFLKYKNYDMIELLTELYDPRTGDDGWRYKTKTQGVFVLHDVALNIMGATTPEKFIKSMPEESVSGGFTARILFVFSDRIVKPIYFPVLSEEIKQLKFSLVEDLSLISKLKGEFIITEKTLSKYIKWADSWHGTNTIGDTRFNAYMNRRRTHIIKLMMVMSASRGDDLRLRPEDFDRALEYLEDIEYEMPNVVGGLGASPVAAIQHKIIKVLKDNGGEIKFEDISRILIEDADKETMIRATATLSAANICDIITDASTGDKRIKLKRGVR